MNSAGLRVFALGLLSLAALPFGLYSKLPHLFTADPHLAAYTLPLSRYPVTMGPVWFVLGIAGLVLMSVHAYKNKHTPRWAFILGTGMLLLLSQGPRLFIDIPPVRALLYAIVPLSICAAYFVMHLRYYVVRTHSGFARAVFLGGLAVLVIVPAVSATTRAFATSNHAVASNSTLLPEQLHLAEFLAAQEGSGGVVVDDYNRRSASWLALSGKPMFTRVGAEIQRQMDEAHQSPVRMEIYLRQLECLMVDGFEMSATSRIRDRRLRIGRHAHLSDRRDRLHLYAAEVLPYDRVIAQLLRWINHGRERISRFYPCGQPHVRRQFRRLAGAGGQEDRQDDADDGGGCGSHGSKGSVRRARR
jgi:hypothetical protein